MSGEDSVQYIELSKDHNINNLINLFETKRFFSIKYTNSYNISVMNYFNSEIEESDVIYYDH